MAVERHRRARRQRALDHRLEIRASGQIPQGSEAAGEEHPVEARDVDLGKLAGRCKMRLRFLIGLEAPCRIGLGIGLVGLGIERWLPPAGLASVIS